LFRHGEAGISERQDLLQFRVRRREGQQGSGINQLTDAIETLKRFFEAGGVP
jgi:hypothetical protein